MLLRNPSLLALAAALAVPASAQVQTSLPQPLAIESTIPAPRDVAYPGTMRLDVDATDTMRGIFKVRQTIPVADPGRRMTLLFPQWLPGAHSPRGQIEKVAGLRISAGGRPLRWTRDPVDVFAFHIDPPAGAREILAEFQFLSATAADQGRIVVTEDMMNIQPNSVSLYPAGYFTRRIPVQMNVRYPAGWRAFTALAASGNDGGVTRYETVDYDTLVDSPIFAGRHARQETLAAGIRLNIVADEAANLVAKPEHIAAHRRLVDQSLKLFGGRPFDRYEFLLALTDEMGSIGLEHHRSSENGVNPEYFTKWDEGPGRRNLLPHEFVHSWNGKYRRGADSWTPDFRQPIGNSLLWVYEGQTQFWGYVLGARSGLFTKQETLEALGLIAAGLDIRRARDWRSLDDTTLDPIISQRRPKGWVSFQRSEDYYNEGLLIWLEADAIIRRATAGRRGMDDFAARFFAARDGDFTPSTYRFEDIVANLNAVHPYDWTSFLTRRLQENAPGAPLEGLTQGGYRLAYSEEATAYYKDAEKRGKINDLSYSIGLSLKTEGASNGEISTVVWDSPAFQSGLRVSDKIVAVDGREYSADVIKAAITAAKANRQPIRLLVKSGELYREMPVTWNGGLRYPKLERIGAGGSLDRLLEPRR